MSTRVLIVDDNAPFLDAARMLLEREGDTVVGTASSSAEALRLAARLTLDVILVDIHLSGESGFALARALCDNEHLGPSRPPVILISTHSEADFADLIADSPALGFLPKSDLAADAIAAILRRRRGPL